MISQNIILNKWDIIYILMINQINLMKPLPLTKRQIGQKAALKPPVPTNAQPSSKLGPQTIAIRKPTTTVKNLPSPRTTAYRPAPSTVKPTQKLDNTKLGPQTTAIKSPPPVSSASTSNPAPAVLPVSSQAAPRPKNIAIPSVPSVKPEPTQNVNAANKVPVLQYQPQSAKASQKQLVNPKPHPPTTAAKNKKPAAISNKVPPSSKIGPQTTLVNKYLPHAAPSLAKAKPTLNMNDVNRYPAPAAQGQVQSTKASQLPKPPLKPQAVPIASKVAAVKPPSLASKDVLNSKLGTQTTLIKNSLPCPAKPIPSLNIAATKNTTIAIPVSQPQSTKAKAVAPPAKPLPNPKVGTQTNLIKNPLAVPTITVTKPSCPPSVIPTRNYPVVHQAKSTQIANTTPIVSSTPRANPVPAPSKISPNPKLGNQTTLITKQLPAAVSMQKYSPVYPPKSARIPTSTNILPPSKPSPNIQRTGALVLCAPPAAKLGPQTNVIKSPPNMPIPKPSLNLPAAKSSTSYKPSVQPQSARAPTVPKPIPPGNPKAQVNPVPSSAVTNSKIGPQTTAIGNFPRASFNPPRPNPVGVNPSALTATKLAPSPPAKLPIPPGTSNHLKEFFVQLPNKYPQEFLTFTKYLNKQRIVKSHTSVIFEVVLPASIGTSSQRIVKVWETLKSTNDLEESYNEFRALEKLAGSHSPYFPKVYKFAWTCANGKLRAELLMEYCGENLLQKNRPQATFTASDLLCYLYQCADALNDSKLQFHGDIKPANLCEMNRRIKLIDFGYSFINFPPDKCTVAQYTKDYSSPEVLDAANKVLKGVVVYLKEPKKADVYSLGLTFIELVCRKTKEEIEDYRKKISINPKFAYNFEYNKVKVKGSTGEIALIEKLLKEMLKQDYTKRISLKKILEWTKEYVGSELYYCQVPDFWKTQIEKIEVINVSESSEEYKTVKWLFDSTMKGGYTGSFELQRIQNMYLWKSYAFERKILEEKYRSDPKCTLLFHGTSTNHPSEIFKGKEEGFDMRFSKAGYWGIGIYFAVNAKYSHNYAYACGGGKQQMLLANVLIGESYISDKNKKIRIPPVNPNRKGERYDSVRSKEGGIYVLYKNSRAYPQYLITYY
eukprot:TRINITY_DN6578_c0_g1_i1.p1 TRINITY_DN6578_c0_g1~~TRINITY_DN6578_c0_g1_i1.p1  ORF type:complete len:1139 (+),score=43.24 TRINITY_DN6578_c0_g1_i1:93-3419(+)